MKRLSKIAAAAAVLLTGAVAVGSGVNPAQATVPIDNEQPTISPDNVIIRDDDVDGFAEQTFRVKRPAAIDYFGGANLVCLGDGATDIVITVPGAGMNLEVFDPVAGTWGSSLTISNTTCSFPDPGDGSGATNVWYDFDVRGSHYGDDTRAVKAELFRNGAPATNGPVEAFPDYARIRIPEAISLTATDIDLSQSDGMIEVLLTREDTLGCDSALDREIALFPDTNSAGLVSVIDFNLDFVATPPSGWAFNYTNVADQRLAPTCGNSIPLRLAATDAGVISSQLQLREPGGSLLSRIFQDITVTGSLVTTPPVVTINAPADGATYTVGSVPAVDVACDDDAASLENSENACKVTGYSDQVGTHTMTVSSRSWGGTTTESVTYTVEDVPVDTAPPVVTIGGVADGANYDFGSVPVATCDAVDDVDGSVPCDLTGFSDAIGTHTVTATATDAAGNTGSASATYSVVDATAPSIAILAPADGGTYAEGAVPAPDFACADDESTVTVCEQSGWSDAPGTHTMTVTATSDGGTATQSVTYTVEDAVVPSDFGPGFANPIDPEVVNTGKAQRAFPIKFNVFQGGVEVTDPAALTLTVNSLACGMNDVIGNDAIEQTFFSELPLEYRDGQFFAKLQVGKDGAGCYSVVASMADGSGSTAAYFELT